MNFPEQETLWIDKFAYCNYFKLFVFSIKKCDSALLNVFSHAASLFQYRVSLLYSFDHKIHAEEDFATLSACKVTKIFWNMQENEAFFYTMSVFSPDFP